MARRKGPKVDLSAFDQRMRRCTGLSPSRASGRAREWMTENAYSR